MNDVKISKCKIINIINWKGKKKSSVISSAWKKDYKRIFEKGTHSFKSLKVKKPVTRENLLMQKLDAKP